MKPEYDIQCCGVTVKVEDHNGRCEKCGKEYIYWEDKRKWVPLVFPKNNEQGMKRNRKNVDEFWTETMNKTLKFKMIKSDHPGVDKAIKAPESGTMKRMAVVRCGDGKYRELIYEHLTGKEHGHKVRLLYTKLVVIEPKEGDVIGLIFSKMPFGQYIDHKVLRLQKNTDGCVPKGTMEHYIITE